MFPEKSIIRQVKWKPPYQASQMKNCGTCGTHDTDFVAQGNISVIQIKSQNLGCMAEMYSSLKGGITINTYLL